ncbi:hypothetical protein SCALM49S_03795 [Streptomyces californicus]
MTAAGPDRSATPPGPGPAGAGAPAPARPRPIRVLVADDEPMIRAGVRAVLATDPGVAVVAEAADGRRAAGPSNWSGPTARTWPSSTCGCRGPTASTPPPRSGAPCPRPASSC